MWRGNHGLQSGASMQILGTAPANLLVASSLLHHVALSTLGFEDLGAGFDVARGCLRKSSHDCNAELAAPSLLVARWVLNAFVCTEMRVTG